MTAKTKITVRLSNITVPTGGPVNWDHLPTPTTFILVNSDPDLVQVCIKCGGGEMVGRSSVGWRRADDRGPGGILLCLNTQI